MKFIEKYRELINSPEITAYVGNSAKRTFLVRRITALFVKILPIIPIILISVVIRVINNYLL